MWQRRNELRMKKMKMELSWETEKVEKSRKLLWSRLRKKSVEQRGVQGEGGA